MQAKYVKIFIFFCTVFLATKTIAQEESVNFGIIPAPARVTMKEGKCLLKNRVRIIMDAKSEQNTADFLKGMLEQEGFEVKVFLIEGNNGEKGKKAGETTIFLTLNLDSPPEGYGLYISSDAITIDGRGAGMYYGAVSLLQMIEFKSPNKEIWLPCVNISDFPRFAYRGMHLDVSRHFFPVAFIKKYLDVMAAYKLNYFHWHLTDDQGWRLEIKKYPKLCSVGGFRAQTKVGGFKGATADVYDNTPYGGFYTQADIKEIVEYATKRHITIVPEIEMPGHSQAAVSAYPIMSCDPTKTYQVAETWGVFNDVYCPTDTTFAMLYNILDEVMDLFPGPYVHVGGDECPKDAWKASAFCQKLIKDSMLHDENGLQSYFIRKIERHINAKRKRIIGWDEILEGGLAPKATVMSWRGEEGGIAAAKQQHQVIMTPGSGGLYFDHSQSLNPDEPLSIGGNAPFSKTYSYDPVPATLSADEKKYVIGVQANLWTEYISTEAKAEYMLLPRMLALAEVAWSQKERKDLKDMTETRLPGHLKTLEKKGYNFRVPDLLPYEEKTKVVDAIPGLQPTVKGGMIHYTIDGYTPRETDQDFHGPIKVTAPAGRELDFKAVLITPGGKRSLITSLKMRSNK